MNTPDEIIAVVQAFKDGKQIQARYRNEEWVDLCAPTWEFSRLEYRVKPESKRRWYTVKELLALGAVLVRRVGTDAVSMARADILHGRPVILNPRSLAWHITSNNFHDFEVSTDGENWEPMGVVE